MPWFRTRLPPSPGTVRAIDPQRLVVWTDHGLFRFEPGANTCVRMLHDADEAASKFDAATGVMRGGRERYALVGDQALVPHTSVESALTEDDRGGRPSLALRLDRKRRRVELLEGGEVVQAISASPGGATPGTSPG